MSGLLIAFIIGFLFGAAFLELFWYQRRQRKHDKEDKVLKEFLEDKEKAGQLMQEAGEVLSEMGKSFEEMDSSMKSIEEHQAETKKILDSYGPLPGDTKEEEHK